MKKCSWLLLLLLSLVVVMSASALAGSSGGTVTGGGEGGGPETYAGSASAAGPATTALAWENNPAACAASNFVTDQNANGSLVCAQPSFANLSSTIAIEQVPDNFITAAKVAFNYAAADSEGGPATGVDCTGCVNTTDIAADAVTSAKVGFNYATSVSEGGAATTATALASNGANCSAGNYPLGVDASGAAESCTAVPAVGAIPAGSGSEINARSNSTTFQAVTGSSTANGGIGLVNQLASSTPLTVKAAASQSVNILEINSSSGSGGNLFKIDKDGNGNGGTAVGSSWVFYNGRFQQLSGAASGNQPWVLRTIDFLFNSNFVIGSNSTVTTGDMGVAPDSGISNCGAGIWCFGTGADNNRLGWTQADNTCVVASNQTNATTTPQTWACYVTGTTPIALAASRSYRFHCQGFLSDSTAVDGAAIDFDASTATATTFRQQTTAFDTALNLSSQTTALATDVAASTFTGNGAFESHGYIKVNAAGTFQPRFMQVAHTAGVLTLAEGSNCVFDDVTP